MGLLPGERKFRCLQGVLGTITMSRSEIHIHCLPEGPPFSLILLGMELSG